MNLIGKFLVVLITVMSVAFLGIAISLFSTHHNWKATVDQQKATITELNADREALQTRYRQNVANLDLELDTAEQQVRKLERERVALFTQNESVNSEIDTLKQQRRDTTMAIAQTQTENKTLGERNDSLKQDIATTQTAMNTAFDQAVEATSELHEAKMQLEIELERNAQLLEQVQGN